MEKNGFYEECACEDLLDRADKLIAEGNLDEAEYALKSVKENTGRKYFIESKLYKSKCWYNEARKCLKLAIKSEPENVEYKKALKELEAVRKSRAREEMPKHMGGKKAYEDICTQVCCECCGELCMVGLCEGICSGC